MKVFVFAFALILSAPAAASSTANFRKLLDDHWAWAMKGDPVTATALGIRTFDAILADISLQAADARAAEAGAFLKRLEAIPPADLPPKDRIDRDILKRMLEEQIEANSFGQRTILFTNREGFHQTMAGLADLVPLRTRADYESYLARLAKYPAQNDVAIRITEQAIAKGYTLPCEAMTGFEKSISGVIAPDPTRSRFYLPFTHPRPADATEEEWAAMQARAKALITGQLNPAYAKFDRFYTSSYLPKCNKSVSVRAEPDGAKYYAFRVRQMTTTDMTPMRSTGSGWARWRA